MKAWLARICSTTNPSANGASFEWVKLLARTMRTAVLCCMRVPWRSVAAPY